MSERNGTISINTENIFPIIKKWLYSEKDIFIREIISNASDAICKLEKLSQIGEANISEDNKWKILVKLDKKKKTLAITDNGIGMTEEEIVKYINQIAFSGAIDFMEKYKDKADDAQIIGHFGLGFYSTFMASDKVEIDSLSYKEGAKAVNWTSEEGTEFEITDSDRKERGTTITMHISADSKEFLEEGKVKEILTKYFSFLPVEIYFNDEDKAINDTSPLWLKNPKECTDEEYKEFYKKVFHDFQEPLFWIHLNMEYPFTLKGILYFPRLKQGYEGMEGVMKLYYNQVFVADNIKEVIPEFLMLLKGTIDCPDLPLNVSRSFLQNDGYVNKISAHISKKVADKLKSIFKGDRNEYNKYWDDINPFVKYGCIREEKFYDKIKSVIILKDINGEYFTLEEAVQKAKEADKGSKEEGNDTKEYRLKLYYVTDLEVQSQYVKLFKENNNDAYLLNTAIDSHFINYLESKMIEDGVGFTRIDSDIDGLTNKDNKDGEVENLSAKENLEKIFREVTNNKELKIEVSQLKNSKLPAMVLVSEQARRFRDMSKMYSDNMDYSQFAGMFGGEMTLILNKNNSLIQVLSDYNMPEDLQPEENMKMLVQHVYDMARMAQEPLTGDDLTRFLERSVDIMMKGM